MIVNHANALLNPYFTTPSTALAIVRKAQKEPWPNFERANITPAALMLAPAEPRRILTGPELNPQRGCH